mmetsp:Transcript_12854/g.17761  ORF Transcript_12854/g.17761 Transcript_12854/m.17761 type:complete len:158 (-) Transcript_12854:472-945(-)
MIMASCKAVRCLASRGLPVIFNARVIQRSLLVPTGSFNGVKPSPFKQVCGSSKSYAASFCSSSSASPPLSSKERVEGMNKLLQDFGADFANVQDTSGGCGAFFHIHVVSAKFEGMPLVKRQRHVQKLLHDYIHDVHGTSIKCMTPGQYEKEQEEVSS